MAEKKSGWGGCLMWGAIALVVGATSLCACGGLAAYLVPSWLLSTVISDAPLTPGSAVMSPASADEVRAAWTADLQDDRTVHIAPGELNTVLADADLPNVEVLQFAAQGENLVFDVSYRPEPGVDEFFNGHLATDFDLENGWFESFSMDEMVVGEWDLSQYLVGQEMSAQANENLARQRGDNPELDDLLSQIERVSFDDGVITLVLTEEGTAAALEAWGTQPIPLVSVSLDEPGGLGEAWAPHPVGACLRPVDDKPDGAAPVHVAVLFDGAAPSPPCSVPELGVAGIYVFERSAFERALPASAASMSALSQVIADAEAGEMPFVPFVDASLAVRGKVHSVAFEGGEGVLFMGDFSSEPGNVAVSAVLFQGLTPEHYVLGIVPAAGAAPMSELKTAFESLHVGD